MSLLFAVAALLAGSTAHAMSAAPMCDADAASVVAPIPALPVSAGEIRAIQPCDDLLVNGSQAPGDTAHGDLRAQVPDRVLAGRLEWAAPRPTLRAIDRAASAPLASGHARSVYRPPRS